MRSESFIPTDKDGNPIWANTIIERRDAVQPITLTPRQRADLYWENERRRKETRRSKNRMLAKLRRLNREATR